MTDEIKVGDEVIVTVPPRRIGQARIHPARITKAGPVWLEIVGIDQPWRTWRMRRETRQESWDNRTPGGGIYKAYFQTPAEHAARERVAEARAYLENQGIRITNSSPWHADEALLRLADAVKSLTT